MNGCKVAAGRQEAECACWCQRNIQGGRWREEERAERKKRVWGGGGVVIKRRGRGSRSLYIATNLTDTFTQAGKKVLTAQGCDPKGSAHQRGQAQQHGLLSLSETPHINFTHTYITSLHTQRRTSTYCPPVSLSHPYLHTHFTHKQKQPSHPHTHTHTHTRTRTVCYICKKLGLMTGFVLCVLTQLPPGHTLPTQQKTALHISLYLVLAVSPLSSPSRE